MKKTFQGLPVETPQEAAKLLRILVEGEIKSRGEDGPDIMAGLDTLDELVAKIAV